MLLFSILTSTLCPVNFTNILQAAFSYKSVFAAILSIQFALAFLIKKELAKMWYRFIFSQCTFFGVELEAELLIRNVREVDQGTIYKMQIDEQRKTPKNKLCVLLLIPNSFIIDFLNLQLTLTKFWTVQVNYNNSVGQNHTKGSFINDVTQFWTISDHSPLSSRLLSLRP